MTVWLFPEETRICVDRLSKDRLPGAGGCHPTWEGLGWNKKQNKGGGAFIPQLDRWSRNLVLLP